MCSDGGGTNRRKVGVEAGLEDREPGLLPREARCVHQALGELVQNLGVMEAMMETTF